MESRGRFEAKELSLPQPLPAKPAFYMFTSDWVRLLRKVEKLDKEKWYEVGRGLLAALAGAMIIEFVRLLISSRDLSSAWFLVAAVVSTALLVILRPLPVSASSIVEQAKYIDDEYVRESPAMIMYSVFSGGARQEAAAASESQEQS